MKYMMRKFGAAIAGLVLMGVIMTGCDSVNNAIDSVANELRAEQNETQGEVASRESEQQGAAEDRESEQPKNIALQRAELMRVVDGDTIIVSVNGEKKRVRLIGINTAESAIPEDMLDVVGKENTEEGEWASEFVKNLLADTKYVWLQKDVSDTDKYDRLLRYVWLEEPEDAWDADEVAEKMLNGIIVKNGYSKAVKYVPDTAYYEIFKDIGGAYGS
ncbi:MAG: thermonuclease family protein [Lachnospiraceae bacterium]|nr:thermonuclease family protein [Lachnospiraceae bacterium]